MPLTLFPKGQAGRFRLLAGEYIYASVIDNATNATRISIRGKYVTDDGESAPFEISSFLLEGLRTYELTPSAGPFADGWVTDLTALVQGTAIGRGQCYVQVFAGNGSLAGVRSTLASGYVYAGHSPTLGEYNEDYAEAIYSEQVVIANQAGQGASAIERRYTPADDDEIELIGGIITDQDTVDRTIDAVIDDGTNVLLWLTHSVSLTAGQAAAYPSIGVNSGTGTGQTGPGPRFRIRGPKRVRLVVYAVADGQDAAFSFVAIVRGRVPDVPTRTTVGAGTPVVTVNTSTLEFLED